MGLKRIIANSPNNIQKIAEELKNSQGMKYVMIERNQLKLTLDPKKAVSLKKIQDFFLSTFSNADQKTLDSLKESHSTILNFYQTRSARRLNAFILSALGVDSTFARATIKVISSINRLITTKFMHKKSDLIEEFERPRKKETIKKENIPPNLEPIEQTPPLITEESNQNKKTKKIQFKENDEVRIISRVDLKLPEWKEIRDSFQQQLEKDLLQWQKLSIPILQDVLTSILEKENPHMHGWSDETKKKIIDHFTKEITEIRADFHDLDDVRDIAREDKNAALVEPDTAETAIKSLKVLLAQIKTSA